MQALDRFCCPDLPETRIQMENHSKESRLQAFGDLLDVMDDLRAKCPWDSTQTFESIRPLSVEEVFELSQAILKKQYPEVCKELGDLCLHMVFYAKIAEEQGLFDIQDVLEGICRKLRFRHPHIYGEVKAENPRQVADNWESIKLREKDGNRSVLAGVPETLPSMIKAYRMQDKARGVGFDWDSPEGAWEKVKEEIAEVETEMTNPENGEPSDARRLEQLEGEFGDLFFSLANVARLYGVNPDNALERTNLKFRQRFNYLEDHTIKQGRSLREMSLAEMDLLWEESKQYFK